MVIMFKDWAIRSGASLVTFVGQGEERSTTKWQWVQFVSQLGLRYSLSYIEKYGVRRSQGSWVTTGTVANGAAGGTG